MGEKSGIEIIVVPESQWGEVIGEVVAVRASAYEQWNGLMTEEQCKQEASRWLGKWAERRKPALLVAKRGDRVVGYLSADEREREEYYLSHIGVRIDLSRQGIGRTLVRTCEEVARRYGCRALTTTTYNRFRGMLMLLLLEGFYIQGTTWIEGASEPRIWFRKELTV